MALYGKGQGGETEDKTTRARRGKYLSTSLVASSEPSSSSRWFCSSLPRLLSPERGASSSVQQKIKHHKEQVVTIQSQNKANFLVTEDVQVTWKIKTLLLGFIMTE